ncbi:tyrosine-type recombinase/integrase [Enterobacter ludwigii]|uniref:tyrosine-type recombinase/integrase n=1 Tax=Enterobacter ludwigii TaxID=299767 RepID=UPI003F71699F
MNHNSPCLEQFTVIRQAALTHFDWAPNPCYLTLAIAQHREDISLFRFSDVKVEGYLLLREKQATNWRFHEIRSQASRVYEKERGEEFAQRLLGHKNLTMTKKYLDARGVEYVMV